MTTARKTVSVALLIFKVNHCNRYAKASPEFRQGNNAMLETVLHATGNYNGFNYLPPSKVPYGCAPGINEVDLATASMDAKFEGTDDTRRTYYVSTLLHSDYQLLQEEQDLKVTQHASHGDTHAAEWLYV